MPAPRYRAFLSYSHRDTRLAWLTHWRLERFRIPASLRGRPSPIGPIPDRLHPIFLDRFHFSAGRSLTDQTIEAIRDSAALILLGSPDAARSGAVNQEVQIFHGHNPNQPVVPLILSGSPSDPANPCFPPALLGLLGPNPVAADWHKDGDRGATAPSRNCWASPPSTSVTTSKPSNAESARPGPRPVPWLSRSAWGVAMPRITRTNRSRN